MNQMLSAAMKYAAAGWPVLPLWWRTPSGWCACGRAACEKSIGKHPLSRAVPRGVNDATCDDGIIRAWWGRFPDGNVGIQTGAPSGLVVLDVDPRNGGAESLAELEQRIGEMPVTPVSITGSLGAHYLFTLPLEGGPVPSARDVGGWPGLDLKADGGYIVAPPSVHASGRSYAWNVLLHPDDVELAPAPEALVAMARRKVEVAAIRSYTPTMERGELSERIVATLRGKLRRRFERDSRGLLDTSPSGVDWSLAALAALEGLSDREVEIVVRASRTAAGLCEKSASYYSKTVAKAVALAEAAGEKRERHASLMLGGLPHA